MKLVGGEEGKEIPESEDPATSIPSPAVAA